MAQTFPLEFETEARINLIRSASIIVLYGVHLVNYLSGGLAAALDVNNAEILARQIHIGVTAIVLGWLMVSFGVYLALAQRLPVRHIGSISTAFDIVYLTGALIISTGPRGPLVVGYFLIIMLSGLRHRLALVWWTSAGSISGYLVVLAFAKWPSGWFRTLGIESVPRYHQIMIVMALIIAGVIAGQSVRRFLTLSRVR